MLNPLFSLQFFWIALAITVLSVGLAIFCSWLHQQLMANSAGEWLLEHVYCPLAKVLLLMLMAFLLFPLVVEQTRYSDLINLLMQQNFIINMVNILFVSSLLLSFLPAINHPAFAMPLLGCIAIGLIFMHQVVLPSFPEIEWIPAFGALVKIFILMVFSYLVGRWLSNHLSSWLDYKYNVTGSKELVTDINHLIFQMPILLAYGHSLQSQTV